MKLTKDNLCEISRIMNFKFDRTTVFIETGTHKGDTCFEMACMFEQIHTIEIVPDLYRKFLQIKPVNVHAHLGDSSKVLKEVYGGNNRIIFWLDGHYVYSFERWSDLDCPLLEELKVIISKYSQECLILIDDVRLFDTNINEDWSGVNTASILGVLGDRVVYHKIFGDVMAIIIRAVI